jgi:hypothetical protein
MVKRAQNCWEVIEAIDSFRTHCRAIRERSVIPDNSFDRRMSR